MVGATADVVNDADDEAINAIDTKGEQGRKRKRGLQSVWEKKEKDRIGQGQFYVVCGARKFGF